MENKKIYKIRKIKLNNKIQCYGICKNMIIKIK